VPNDNKKEEYRALREEVVRLEREQVLVAFYVLTTAIAAARLMEETGAFSLFVPVLYFVIIIWGSERYFIASKLRVKLSTYIQTVIEPQSTGLDWEIYNYKFKKLEKNKTKGAWQHKLVNIVHGTWWRRLTNIFTLLVIIDAYIIHHFVILILDYDLSLQTALLLLCILVLFFVRLCYLCAAVFLYPNPEDYVERWKDVLAEDW